MLPLKVVQAKRAVLETDGQGRLKFVPTLPPDAQIEAIFLVLNPEPKGTPEHRHPSSLASGSWGTSWPQPSIKMTGAR